MTAPEHLNPDTPNPDRYPALASTWVISDDEHHPDRFVVTGNVAGEPYWEEVGPETEAHSLLRAGAIERLPELLAELVEAHDIIRTIAAPLPESATDADELRFPDFTHPDGTHDRTGRRLAALARDSAATLSTIQNLARGLGLDLFAVAHRTPQGLRALTDERFTEHRAAYDRCRELVKDEAKRQGTEFGPDYMVVPARLLPDPTGENHV